MKTVLVYIASRILSFWYQIYQYMFLTFIWASLVQFHNFTYPPDSPRSPALNGMFCIASLLLFLTLAPLCHRYLLRRQSRIPTH